MTTGLAGAQLNDIWRLLRELKLAKEKNDWPDYSRCGASHFRGLTYADTWRRCYENRWFNFLLQDYAILQFLPNSVDEENTELRFAYLDCPTDFMTYDQFLQDAFGTTYKTF